MSDILTRWEMACPQSDAILGILMGESLEIRSTQGVDGIRRIHWHRVFTPNRVRMSESLRSLRFIISGLSSGWTHLHGERFGRWFPFSFLKQGRQGAKCRLQETLAQGTPGEISGRNFAAVDEVFGEHGFEV